MAGTTSVSRSTGDIGITRRKRYKAVTVSFTADSADGSVPDTSVGDLGGWVVKVVTNPGATAPTDNYDIVLNDADGVDAFAGAGANRDTANSEAFQPVISGAATPVFLPYGSYTLAISNNSVNSATGTVTLYVAESL